MVIGAVALLFGILVPPIEYQRKPTVPYTVEYTTQAVVNGKCKLAVLVARLNDKRVNALGCTNMSTNQIYIVEGLPTKQREIVLLHEIAHINGWKHG